MACSSATTFSNPFRLPYATHRTDPNVRASNKSVGHMRVLHTEPSYIALFVHANGCATTKIITHYPARTGLMVSSFSHIAYIFAYIRLYREANVLWGRWATFYIYVRYFVVRSHRIQRDRERARERELFVSFEALKKEKYAQTIICERCAQSVSGRKGQSGRNKKKLFFFFFFLCSRALNGPFFRTANFYERDQKANYT